MPGGCLDGFEGQRAASVSVGRSVSFGDAVVGHGEVPAADGVAGFCCAGVVGGGDGVGGTVAGGGAGEDDLGACTLSGYPAGLRWTLSPTRLRPGVPVIWEQPTPVPVPRRPRSNS
jgi:hypothetical protein